MNFILHMLQTTPTPQPESINELIDSTIQTVNRLGEIDIGTQFAATISLVIGVVILVLVIEVRNWNRNQVVRQIYVDEIKDLNNKLNDREKQVETERATRFATEEIVVVLKSQIGDQKTEISSLQQLNLTLQQQLTICEESKKASD